MVSFVTSGAYAEVTLTPAAHPLLPQLSDREHSTYLPVCHRLKSEQSTHLPVCHRLKPEQPTHLPVCRRLKPEHSTHVPVCQG